MNRLLILNAVVFVTALTLLLGMQFTGFFVAKPAHYEKFKIGTFAVCYEKEDEIYCVDKLFAVCNGRLVEIVNQTFECNMKKYNIGNISLGSAFMEKNWTDKRPPDFITGWASS